MKEELLTIEQAAKELGVSTKTMRRWDISGKLSPQRTIGNHRRYTRAEIEAFKLQKGNAAPVQSTQAPNVAIVNSEPVIQTPSVLVKNLSSLASSPQSQADLPIQLEDDNYAPPQVSVESEHSGFQLSPVSSGSSSKRNGIMVLSGLAGIVILLFAAVYTVPSNRMFAQARNTIAKVLPGMVTEKAAPTQAPGTIAHRSANEKSEFTLRVNVPGIFSKKVTFLEDALVKKTLEVEGKIIAPNVIYSITAGENVTISGDPQNPVISADLSGGAARVVSVQGLTGDVQFVAGDGLSLSGTTFTNSDPGSAQSIFKNFTINGSDTITAGANNDTINFSAGSGITLTGEPGSKTITIASSGGSGGLSGLTTDGVLYATSSTTVTTTSPPGPGQVLLGNSSGIPTFTALSGDLSVNGNGVVAISPDSVMLGTDTTGDYQLSTVAGNGITVSGTVGEGWSPTIGINLTTTGTTASTSSNSGLELTSGGLSMLRGCTTGQILKWNGISGNWECNTDATGGGGGGSGITTITGNSFSSNDSTTLNFSNEFALTESPLTQTNVAIDYTNSRITRENQNQTISGIWNFASRLGIGASNPTASLDVQGNFGNNAAVIINQQNSGNILVASSSGTTRFVIANNGDLTATGSLSGLTGLTSSGTIAFSGLGTGIVRSTGGTLSTGAVTNAELQNSSITINTGTGLSGGGVVALGGTLNLANTGVTSITGTPNQVNVSGSTGAITLSLPQDIAATSSPTFNGLTVSSLTRGVDTITDFTGDGLQVVGGALQAALGTTVDLTTEVTGTLGAGNGGTGFNSYSNGDLLYGSGGSLARLPLGGPNQYLAAVGGTLQWIDVGGNINFWQSNAGALSPYAISNDFLIGGNATGSARFRVSGTTGQIVATNTISGLTGISSSGTITFSGLSSPGLVHTDGSGNLSTSLLVNADVAASAGIAFSKLGNLNTGQILIGNGGTPTAAMLGGDATIDASGNLTLANSGVTANTYGNATTVPQIVVDAKGRITGVTPVSIAIAASQITSGTLSSARGGTGADLSAAAQYSLPYFSSTGVMGALGPGTDGYVLTTHGAGGAPTWTNAAALGTNYWQRTAGALAPQDIADDLLVGGAATGSAKFRVSGTTGAIVATNTLSGLTGLSSSGTVTFSGLNTTGLVHNDASGNLSTSLLVNADVANGAGIAFSKLATLNTGQILVGNGGTATASTLGGDATIDASGNLTLANSGVSATTYGSASQVPVFAVDAKGRVTSVTNTNIAIAASQITSGSLSSARGGTGADLSGATQYSVPYFSSTGVMSALGPGTDGYVLTTHGAGSAPTWTNAASLGTNYWQRALGALSPLDISDDLLVGGAATGSAKFRVSGTTGAIVASNTLSGLTGLSSSGTVTFSGLSTAGLVHNDASGNLSTSLLVNADVASNAGISFSKLASLSTGQVLVGNGGTATAATLGGDATIDASGNLTLANSGVSATTYGSASQVPVFAVDAKGRVTSVTNTNIAIAASQITSGSLSSARGGTGADLSAAAQYSVPYFGSTGVMTSLAPGTDGYVLTTHGAGSAPTWTNAASLGTNYWQRALGALSPLDISDDLLVGGAATGSAKFRVSGTTGAIVATNTLSGLTGLSSSGTVTFTGLTTTGLVHNDASGNLSTSLLVNADVANGAGIAFSKLGTLNTGQILVGNGGTATAATLGGDATIDASGNLTLANSGVSATTYGSASQVPVFAVDAKGRITSVTNTSIAIDASQITGGTLGVNRGGTGITSVGSAGGVAYSNGTTYAFTGVGTSNQCLVGGTTPTWSSCGVNYWQQNNGAVAPLNITDDLLLGGTATSSAKFAFINNAGAGTPTASISGTTSNVATYLDGNGNLGTTNAFDLKLGTSSTGNVSLNPGGTTALTALANGNIGIGDTSPAGLFTVGSSDAFQVDGSGNVSLAGGGVIDTRSAGILNLGTTNATTINLGKSSGTDVNIRSLGGANNSILFADSTSNGKLTAVSPTSSAGLCLLSGLNTAAPGWGACPGAGTGNYWQENSGVLAPGNGAPATDKLVLGGNTTTVHQFEVNAAVTGKALVALNETGNQDILTASASGATRFTIANNGDITITSLAASNNNSVLYTDNAGKLTAATTGTGGLCLLSQSGSTPVWGTCPGAGNGNYWQLTSGALAPADISNDLLVGGAATGSARFRVSGTTGAIVATNTLSGLTGLSSSGTVTFSGLSTAGLVHNDASGNLSTSLLVNADVATNAGIAFSKLASLSTGQILVGNGGTVTAATLGGDATIDASGNLTLANSGVSANTYGSASQVPVFAVDAKGRITSVTNTNIAIAASQITSGSLSSARGGTGADLSGAAQYSVPYFGSTGVMTSLAPGTDGYVLTTHGAGSAPTWTNAASLGTNYWQRALGALSPLDISDDLLVGGAATGSAKFRVSGTTGNIVASGTLSGLTGLSSSGTVTFSGLSTAGLVHNDASGNLSTSLLVNADVANGAGIAFSKLGTLNTGQILVGNGGTATAATLGGDATIDASGNLTLANSGVSATTYGSASQVPVFAVDAKGRVTSVTNTNIAIAASQITSGSLSSARGGTGADLSGATQYSVPYFSSTGVMSSLAPGTDGYVLTTHGAGSAPTWTNAASLGTNYWQRALGALSPLDISDDLLVGGAATGSAKFRVSGTTGAIVASNTLSGLTGLSSSGTVTFSGLSTAGLVHNDASGNLSTSLLVNADVASNAGISFSKLASLSTGQVLVGNGGTATAATLGGDATIDASGNLTLANSGVSATTYGSASQVPVFAVDAKGRVTSVTNTNIAIAASQITSGSLSSARGGTGADLSGAAQYSVPYFSSTGVMSALGPGTDGYVLTTHGAGGAPTWTNAASLGTNYWQRTSGALAPQDIADDLLVGGAATGSAKFRVSGTTGAIVATNTLSGLTGLSSSGTVTFSGLTTVGLVHNDASGNLSTSLLVNADVASNAGISFSKLATLNTGQIIVGNGGTATATTLGGDATIDASGNLTLANSGVSANTYGSASQIPVFAVDAKGRITSVTNTSIAIDASQITSGTLGVNRGGTGITSVGSAGGIAYSNGTTFALTSPGTANQCLIGGTTPTWGSCATGNTNFWQELAGAVSPVNTSADLLLGASATSSAKFAFTGNNGTGTPTASISAGLAGGLRLDATGLIATTAKQSLSLGDANTGNILFNGGNVGIGTSAPATALQVNGGICSTTGTNCTGVVAGQIRANGAGGSLDLRTTGSGADITSSNALFINSGANRNVYIAPNSTGLVGIGTTTPFATLGISANSGTLPVASVSGATTFASTIIDQSGNGDIFTASKSGATKFTILNNGNIQMNNYTTSGGLLFTNTSGNVLQTSTGTNTQCLIGGATPTWGSCATGNTNFWQELAGAVSPVNTSADLLLGASATSSAKFAFTGNNGTGTPTASIAGTIANVRTFLTGNGSLGTTNAQTLTLGTSSTGNVVLAPGGVTALTAAGANLTGAGTFTSTGLITGNNGLTVNTGNSNINTTSGNVSIGNSSGTVTLTLGSDARNDIYFRNASGNLARLAIGASGTVLTSNGSGSDPTWSAGFVNDATNGTLTRSGSGPYTLGLNLGSVNTWTGTQTFNAGATIANNQTLDINSGSFLKLSGQAASAAVYTDSQSRLTTTAPTSGTIGYWTRTGTNLSPSSASDTLSLGTTSPLATFDVRGNSGTTPVASVSGNTAQAALVVDNSGVGDIFTASSSGLSRFVIKNNGNIGIGPGIANPQYNLDIAGNTNSSTAGIIPGMRIINTNTTGNSYAAYDLNGGNGAAVGRLQVNGNSGGTSMYLYSTTATPLSFGTNSLERGRFSSAGLFAINNSSPNAVADIRGVGTSTLDGTIPVLAVSGTTSNATGVFDNSGVGDLLTASKSGATRFTINNAGDLVLGTTNRITQAGVGTFANSTVVGTATFGANSITDSGALSLTSTGANTLTLQSAGTGNIQFFNGNNTISSAGNLTLAGTSVALTGTNPSIASSSTNRLDLTGNSATLSLGGVAGTVGIGTISPLATFDVRGNSNSTPVASISGANAKASLIVDQSGGGDIFAASKSGESKFVIKNDGKVGIGTAIPVTNLDIRDSGSLAIASISATPGGIYMSSDGVLATTNKQTLSLGDSNTTGNILFNGGNFGVGTNAPTEKLDVAGNLKLTGSGGGSTSSQGFEGVTFPPASPGTWTTGGNANWSRVTTSSPQEGSAHAQAATSITDSQISWLDLDYTFSNPGTISFWWKVSSESTFDFLIFCVDNDTNCTHSGSALNYRISGTTSYTQITYSVSKGTHSFRWAYAKDDGGSSGTDTGWVDNVVITENGPGGNIYADGSIVAGNATTTATAVLDVYGDMKIGTAGARWRIFNENDMSSTNTCDTATTGTTDALCFDSDDDNGTSEMRLDTSGNLNLSGAVTASSTTVSSGGNPDIAEQIPVDDLSIEVGDIVSTGTSAAQRDSVYDSVVAEKTTTGYQTSTLGIIADNPSLLIGNKGVSVGSSSAEARKSIMDSDRRALAIAGRVITKVSTINGPIKPGDNVTSSVIPGMGMKATEAGQTVGKAMQYFDPAKGYGTVIPCPAGTDPTIICGKIISFVNVSWYDPGVGSGYSLGSSPSELAAQFNLPQGNDESDKTMAGLDHYEPSQEEFDMKVASSSSVLSLKTEFGKLSDRLSLIEQQASTSALINNAPGGFTASSAAELGLDKLDVADATITNNLTVLGRAMFSDVGLTGKLTAGLLSINGLDESGAAAINTTAGDLKLQSTGLHGIDILDGKLTIDTKGNLKTEGEISTRKLNITTGEVAGASIGSVNLIAGKTKVIVKTTALTPKSEIFVQPQGIPVVTAVKKTAADEFEIRIKNAEEEDIRLSWWIVN